MLIVTCGALLAPACRDNVTDVRESPRTLTIGPHVAADLYDSGINYNDTWATTSQTVSDTTVVSANEAFPDPETGQQTTSTTVVTPPENVQSLAGYGYDGQVRVTTAFDASSPSETQQVQQVGDATGDVDQAGDPSSTPLDVEPIADLGTLQDAQIDPTAGTGGGGGGSGGSGCSPYADQCDPQMAVTLLPPLRSGQTAGSGAATPRIIRTQVDATHIRLTEPLDAATVVSRPRGQSPTAHHDLLHHRTGSDQNVRGSQAAGGPATPSATRSGRLTRDYEKQDGEWMLKHILTELSIDGPGGHLQQRHHVQITSMRFHRNPEMDAQRKARRANLDTVSRVAAHAVLNLPLAQKAPIVRQMVACDGCADGGSGSGSSSFVDPPPPDETVIGSGDFSDIPQGDGPTLVLQHGFWSSAETFKRMGGWLAKDMDVYNVVRHSLNWTDYYEDQASQLQVALRTYDVISSQGAILIGHSNGGMISRYLARHPNVHSERAPNSPDYYDPIPVRGVVTIGTPHLGTPVARYGAALNLLLGIAGGTGVVICYYTQGGGCQLLLRAEASGMAHYFSGFLRGPIPVLEEMQPTDYYHATFNDPNQSPEGFQRYGIQSYMWHRWQFFALYGDAHCYSDQICGGHATAKKADRIYHHDITCSVIGMFTFRWNTAAGCIADGAFLRLFDHFYIKYAEPVQVSDDNVGDGVVPGWSQRYPNIPDYDQFPVRDGPSHTGETKDHRVGQRVEQILAQKFHIPQYLQTP